MVDTIRTRSALAALFPDNTSGDISPQDLRDFLISANLRQAVNEQTGASYTFAIGDADSTVVFNRASAQAITIPTNAAVPFPIGTRIRCFRKGLGLPTISAGSASPTEVFLRLPAAIKPNRFMGAMARKSVDQTAANYTSATAITFDTDVYDTDGFHDTGSNTSRMTIPSGLGITKVNVGGSLRAELVTTTNWLSFQIWLGGSSSFDGASSNVSDVGVAEKNASALALGVSVVSGNYFEMALQVETDTSISIMATRTSLGIEVTEIAPVGSIAYQYGFVMLEKIGTNEWIIEGPGLG